MYVPYERIEKTIRQFYNGLTTKFDTKECFYQRRLKPILNIDKNLFNLESYNEGLNCTDNEVIAKIKPHYFNSCYVFTQYEHYMCVLEYRNGKLFNGNNFEFYIPKDTKIHVKGILFCKEM